MIYSIYFTGLTGLFGKYGASVHLHQELVYRPSWAGYFTRLPRDEPDVASTYQTALVVDQATLDQLYERVIRHNWALYKKELKPGDGLVFIVTTAQLEKFNSTLPLLGLDTQKKYVLPPARNGNYPERVSNPDKGFCLHTFVFELNKEFFDA